LFCLFLKMKREQVSNENKRQTTVPVVHANKI
jgi:hypothetical protein